MHCKEPRVPQSSVFLLTFNEGMSDAVSWRAQENSERNKVESAVHKVWISLISGKTESLIQLFNTLYESKYVTVPLG